MQLMTEALPLIVVALLSVDYVLTRRKVEKLESAIQESNHARHLDYMKMSRDLAEVYAVRNLDAAKAGK